MGSIGEWQSLAQKCIKIQEDSLPKQWALTESQLSSVAGADVTSVPLTSGLLSDLEIQITEQSANGILTKYSCGEWTVRQVTIAFLKRATIGQQLVW